jgi:hypothetical protein
MKLGLKIGSPDISVSFFAARLAECVSDPSALVLEGGHISLT